MIIYDFILFLIFVLYLPVMLVKGKGHSTLGERFGFIPPRTLEKLQEKNNIWIHAVSVGEVFAVRGLIQLLREKHTDKQVVLTVSTKTGHALAKELLDDEVVLLWAPIDLSEVVRTFILAIQPVIYVAVETEIWPNQFRLLSHASVPSLIVNGRISDRSWSRYRLFKKWFRSTLEKIDFICVQSDLDAQRFRELGATEDRLTVVHSIKWDDEPKEDVIDRAKIGFGADDLVWVAGSTHPGEEEVILDAYNTLREEYPALRLVLVPRHVERAVQIELLIQQRELSVCYLNDVVPKDENSVLLVNEMGWLKRLYAVADVVFVGKSLRRGGGHNIIEPAYAGKPIVIGPMMENFKNITQAFVDAKAIIQIQHDDELVGAVKSVLNDDAYRDDLSQRMRDVIQAHRGATTKTLSYIDQLMADEEE